MATVQGLLSNGNQALEDGKLQEAIDFYSKGIEQDTSKAKSHLLYEGRSHAYTDNKEYTKAKDDAIEVIKLKPEWGMGYYRKGIALEGLENYAEAMEAYDEGLKQDSMNEDLKTASKECSAKLANILPNPFSELKEIVSELKAHKDTKDYFKHSWYEEMLKDLSENPRKLTEYVQKPEMQKTLSALLGFDLMAENDENTPGPSGLAIAGTSQ
uniref:Stress-induced-phosphoprotein 1-like n=1 Tax=Ciona intestinalis TaxID=7719 RepID=F7B9B6_CIOIN|nr:stress-induced-phosphoprotein 1-like isoform X2 [Ciona intestinalis]|eukprot:XP_002128295.2 stress-induced-phosphoprotein 1-like isoform X2 [Ciona intestinalis]